MHREWAGSVFLNKETKGRSYIAKYLDFVTQKWIAKKGFKCRPDAREFLEAKRKEFRARQRGEFNESTEQGQRPIQEHVADFESYLFTRRKVKGKGHRAVRHSKLSSSRLLAAFKAMDVRTLRDLSLDKVQKLLSGLTDQGLRAKTRNDYLAVLRHFADWAADDNRLATNPIYSKRKLRRIDESEDRKKRQAVSWDTGRAIAAAMIQRQVQKAPKKNRETYIEIAKGHALIVTISLLSGLRNNEIASARWRWLDLQDEILRIPADVQGKSGRASTVPLYAGLAELLRRERRRRSVLLGGPVSDDDLVVGTMVNGVPKLPRHIAERIRAAAAWIDHPVIDDKGRVLDLHAMRKSFNVNLRRCGAPKDVRVDLMRHKPIGVTDTHYDEADLNLEPMRVGINTIPADAAHVPGLFGEPSEEPNAMRVDDDERASVSRATGS